MAGGAFYCAWGSSSCCTDLVDADKSGGFPRKVREVLERSGEIDGESDNQKGKLRKKGSGSIRRVENLDSASQK